MKTISTKAKIIAAVVIVLIAAIIVTAISVSSAAKKKELEGYARAEQKVCEDIVLPIAEKHGLDDTFFVKLIPEPEYENVNCLGYFNSESFSNLSDEDKFLFMCEISDKSKKLRYDAFPNHNSYDWSIYMPGESKIHTQKQDYYKHSLEIILTSGDDEYTCSGNYTYNEQYEGCLYKNGSEIYSHYVKTEPKKRPSSSSGKCIICNGTGYVKYYYGESDLEAYLAGQDPYTVGKCTSCNGRGY
jgi:hypothetical protein